jgi:hypothetical protein
MPAKVAKIHVVLNKEFGIHATNAWIKIDKIY